MESAQVVWYRPVRCPPNNSSSSSQQTHTSVNVQTDSTMLCTVFACSVIEQHLAQHSAAVLSAPEPDAPEKLNQNIPKLCAGIMNTRRESHMQLSKTSHAWMTC